jgi:hypothetical protein
MQGCARSRLTPFFRMQLALNAVMTHRTALLGLVDIPPQNYYL